MTEDQLIADIFHKEGDYYAGPPQIDQPTARGGITLPLLQQYFNKVKTSHVQATIEHLKRMTRAEATDVIRWHLRNLAQMARIDFIQFEPLKLQMIDFAYNSGQSLAIRWLQRVLRVPRTGKIDNATIAALNTKDLWLVNEALVAARLRMIDMSTDGTSVDKKFEEGLENRAHSFSLLEIP